MKTFITTDGKQITRLSRWISIQHNYNPNKNNHLFDFSTDGSGYHPYNEHYNPTEGTYLDYFRWNGTTYAIEQFIAIGSMMCSGTPETFIDTDGKITVVGYVDFYGNIFNPLYLEIDEYGEKVRVYEIN